MPSPELAIRSVYPAPPGAIYVATSGDDVSGTGSLDRPFATLAKAVAAAPKNGTVVLRGGVHRQGNIAVGRPVTIQGYRGEQAWLDGSVVPSGWVAIGGRWRLPNSPSAGLCRLGVDPCVQDPSQIDPQHPMAGSPQSVLRNGVKLREVASASAVGPGSFYFDPVSGSLEIGDDPTTGLIEVVTSARGLNISASNVTIRGLGVRNFGSILNPGNVRGFNLAAVQAAGGSNLVVENVVFFQNAARGLFVSGSTDVRVAASTFVENGFNGLDVFASARVLVERNRVLRNNAEHFGTAAGAFNVAAGSKMVRTTGLTVRDNVFDSNAATGWWCDEGCTGATVVRNRFSRNAGHGIFYEVSGGAVIASNLVLGNGNNGIYVLGPDNVVWNNTVVGNRQALAFYEDPRNRGPLDNTRNNVASNNVLANAPGQAPNNLGQPAKLVDVQGFGYPESVDPGTMVTQLDHNAYDRGALPAVPVVGWGWAGASTAFPDLASLQAATGRELNGIPADGGTTLTTNAAKGTDPQPDVAVSIAATGAGLPPAVAAAIGVPAGATVGVGAVGRPAAG